MKDKIREQILERRNKMEELAVKELSERIAKHLEVMDEFTKAKVVMFYASFGKEVFTHDLVRKALLSKQVLLPKVEGEGITPSLILSFDNLIEGYNGILEPIEAMPVKYSNIDLVVVPGIAFDRRGHRLGYRKGFYDKFLKKVPRAVKVGLAYGFQLVGNIPEEGHDVPVDFIVTEDGPVKCDRE